MITADKVKNQIQTLINTANEKTGNDDADLTSAVGSLVDVFGGGVEIERSLFGNVNEVTGTNMVICDYVNENEHIVSVQLSSDTETDFKGRKVVKQGINFFDISKFQSSRSATVNDDGSISLFAYAPDLTQKISQCCPNIHVGQTVYFKANNGLSIYFGGKVFAANTPIEVTQQMLDYNTFGFYGIQNTTSQDNPHIISDIMIVDESFKDSSYEPYFSEPYYANEGGSVDGVTSLSSNMHIICAGVDINAKYYCIPDVEWHRFWDSYQENGKRIAYQYSFAGKCWGDKTFKPKYDIQPTDASSMFYQSIMTNVYDILDANDIVIDFSKVRSATSIFNGANATRLGILDLSNSQSLSSTFAGAKMEKIDKIVFNENCTFSSTFTSCVNLVSLVAEGTIGKGGLNFSWSPLLDNESVQSIIDCLKDLTGQATATITFHGTTKGNMTEAQIATITSKNWTLA